MDERIAYDEDFYAWSQNQAAVLRDLATRRDLPNDLDLEHVAEEIEDVGTAELNSVCSMLRNMLAHMIKLASSSNSEPKDHWFDGIPVPPRRDRAVFAIDAADDRSAGYL